MARVREKRKKKKEKRKKNKKKSATIIALANKMNSIHPLSMEIRNMARVKEKRKKEERQIVLRQFRVRPL